MLPGVSHPTRTCDILLSILHMWLNLFTDWASITFSFIAYIKRKLLKSILFDLPSINKICSLFLKVAWWHHFFCFFFYKTIMCLFNIMSLRYKINRMVHYWLVHCSVENLTILFLYGWRHRYLQRVQGAFNIFSVWVDIFILQYKLLCIYWSAQLTFLYAWKKSGRKMLIINLCFEGFIENLFPRKSFFKFKNRW